MKKISIIVAGFLAVFVSCPLAKAQVLRDTVTFNLMREGVNHIYNLEMSAAEEIYNKIVRRYPMHPITYVYKGLLTYWGNYPLIPGTDATSKFEQEMHKAIDLCDVETNADNEAEYLLANIGARGLLLLFYADNDLSKNVISNASGTYQYIKKCFDFTKDYADFYFVTGLYNYYREAYPEAHPVYKPLALLFPRGNKAKGLKELQIAAKNSIVLKAESYSFLSGIYISFENNFQQAYQYSKSLHELYPANIQYQAQYIKNLLLVKKFSEAESIIRVFMEKSTNAYFNAQLNILYGIVLEKKYMNNKQAQSFYVKGINEIVSFGAFGNEFAAYGYYGLSRIVQDKHLKKDYRKKALELADFKNVNFDN